MAIPLVQLLEDPNDNEVKLWKSISAMRGALQGAGGPLSGWGFSSGDNGSGAGGIAGEVVYLGLLGQLTVDGTCLLFENSLDKRVGVNTCLPAYPLDVNSNECDSKVIALRTGNLSSDIDLFPNYDVNPKVRIRATRPASPTYAQDYSGTLSFYTANSSDVLNPWLSIGPDSLVDSKGKVSFSGVISPPPFGNVNNWEPTGFDTAENIRVNNNGSMEITGMKAGTAGRIVTIHNVNGNVYTITLKQGSASSAAANRFDLPNRTDMVIPPGGSVTLQYDAVSSVWRTASNTSAISGSGGNGRVAFWSGPFTLIGLDNFYAQDLGFGNGFHIGINVGTSPVASLHVRNEVFGNPCAIFDGWNTNGDVRVDYSQLGTMRYRTGLNNGTAAPDWSIIKAGSSNHVLKIVAATEALTGTGSFGSGTHTPNYGAWGKAVSVESATTVAFEAVSSRADASGADIGSVGAWYKTNSVNHNRIAEIHFVTDGATVNQRGGMIQFFTKPNASTSLTERLRIDNTGTIFFGTASAYDAAGKKLGIGTTTPALPVHIQKDTEVAGDDSGILADLYNDSDNAVGFFAVRRRLGAIGAQTALTTGKNLGVIYFQGSTGTNEVTNIANGATISAFAAENWTTSSAPGFLSFNTVPSGSLVANERMRIAADGNVGVGGIPTTRFHVLGSLANNTGSHGLTNIAGVLTGNCGGASGEMFSLWMNTSFTPSASISLAAGFRTDVSADPGSGVTISTFYGGRFIYYTGNGAGSITNVRGLELIPVYGTIKPTNAYGLLIGNQGASGISNAYGLYVEAQSGATNNFGIASLGPVAVAANGASLPSVPDAILHLRSGTDGVSAMELENTSGGANGVALALYANSATPADNDIAGTVNCFFKDDSSTMRQCGAIINQVTDVTSTTLDSQYLFATMNNVNGGGVNTFASLTNAGVWTDAPSSLGFKEYEGTPVQIWGDVLGKIKQLQVSRFHSRGAPLEKQLLEKHCGPTMDEMFDIFGIGTIATQDDPRLGWKKGRPIGIAALDVAGIALVGVQQLLARVELLEKPGVP